MDAVFDGVVQVLSGLFKWVLIVVVVVSVIKTVLSDIFPTEDPKEFQEEDDGGKNGK